MTGVTASRLDEVVAASPAWLASRRRAAWAAYNELPMPSSHRDEDWRRTDLGKLDFATLGAATEEITIEAPDAVVAEGVIVDDLTIAATKHEDLVRHALERIAPGETKFVALNAALWQRGTFVYVPAGVSASVPIWIKTAAHGDAALAQPLTVIVLGEGASVTVVETCSSNTAVVTNALTVIDAAANSSIDYVVVQQQSSTATHFAVHRAFLAKDARLTMFGMSLGSTLQKSYWECMLEGRGAEANIWGVAAARDDQHLDHQSLQAHIAPDTTSKLSLKTAVWDKAQSVYSGLIDVAPEAVHADGYVQNRNLILSNDARAHSIPRLEIKASDVRCGHGATAGHIDDDQRFYLESRGVPRAEADRMIVRAFFDDALLSVRHDDVRDYVTAALEAKIAHDAGNV